MNAPKFINYVAQLIQFKSFYGEGKTLSGRGKAARLIFFMFFLHNGGVAGVRERLPKADIAAHSRRKGCVGDAALRGSDQGEPPKRFPHQRPKY